MAPDDRDGDLRPVDGAQGALPVGVSTDPQGQDRQAQRIRVCDPAGGGDREHPARGTRVDPAGLDRTGPTNATLEHLAPERVFISGRQEPGSRRTNRRLQRYRTGAEGRISHLKRRYGLGRSRLKGDEGEQIWTEWAILAYNADTLAVRTR